MNVNDDSLIDNVEEESSNLEVDRNITICGKSLNLTRHQLITTALLATNLFLSSAYYSLFAPFFPAESIKKGITQTQVGIIFAVLEFLLLILSPVFGKYVIKFSSFFRDKLFYFNT
jgi:hypothetical protein